jgi:hypothetical protein
LPGSLTQDRSPTGTPKSSGYFSIKDTARSMHGFVPERSFIRDRRVIDMRIDSLLMVLRHARPVLPADHGFHRVYRRARQRAGHGAGRISQPRRHSRQSHRDGEAAQNATA